MPGQPPPTPDFARAALDLTTFPAGARVGHVHLARYADPLGFGKTQTGLKADKAFFDREWGE